ncbi:uncharacterized protein E6C27_scaffold226G00400 [Cucumis melo var. makuwa]|uniref:Uncharacterized protein n=1 Tax=Cucumis melo var. makuwa TaxID=1194695 RepID=A0A5A7URV1_CUCMM|nr:uncharacterized protein E6C27_scaffold226G00400 [Cucumis melo var. makuwa]
MDIRRKASKIEISRKISGEKAYIFGGVKSERGNLRSIEGCMDRPEKSVQRQHGFSAYDELLPFLEPHSLTVVSHGPISPRKVALHRKKFANNKSPKSYSLYNYPFAFQVWAYEIVSSVSGWVANDKRAYLDRSLETPMTKGYEEGCMTLLLIMLSMLLHPLMSIAPLLLLMSSIPLSLLVKHLRLLEGKLDRMDEFLDQMQSSITAELSTIKELLVLLVKGKAVDSQQCYGGGEGTSFNASKVGNLVDDVFVDFSALIIDN